jgi:hypothetical protein
MTYQCATERQDLYMNTGVARGVSRLQPAFQRAIHVQICHDKRWMLNWIVIGVGDITTKRVLPAILEEPRSRLVGIVTAGSRKSRTVCRTRRCKGGRRT